MTLLRPVAPALRWARQRLRRGGVVAVLAVLALTVSACNSTNTYPIDFFSEMHYSEAWGPQEPPRVDSPEGAVPFRTQAGAGYMANIDFTLEEAADLENPLEADDETLAMGAELYSLNCDQCHGADGMAETFIAAYWTDVGVNPPANLTSDEVQNLEDGEIFHALQYGREGMPPFRNLLTPEQRWALVLHIREEFGGGQ